VAIPRAINVVGQSEVSDAGTILLKSGPNASLTFVDSFHIPDATEVGARSYVRRDVCVCQAKASGWPQSGSFWLWEIAIALWFRMNSLPDCEGPPMDLPDRQLSSYFLLIFAV
jgi:hypothetical protein